MRVKSLSELGKGGWKVSSITPIKTATNQSIDKTPVKRLKSVNVKMTPQQMLFIAAQARWPEIESEYPANIPGRKFRIDMALPNIGLALELDGWQWHAKHLEDFKRDRRRQNLLVTHGWRVLRFTAEDVKKDIDGCLQMIEDAINAPAGIFLAADKKQES